MQFGFGCSSVLSGFFAGGGDFEDSGLLVFLLRFLPGAAFRGGDLEMEREVARAGALRGGVRDREREEPLL